MFISPNIPSCNSPERPGGKKDLNILKENRWLMNTEVIYLLQERRSLWHLTMIYVAVNNPFRFICKKIDTYNSEKKAEIFAKILQRGIRKDARGTLKTNRNAFNICSN